MQRHGHHDDRAGGQRRLECGNGLGQHASQNLGRWPNLAELQLMNQIAQGAIVAAIGDRALKRRRSQATEAAARIDLVARALYGEWQGLTANSAIGVPKGPKRVEAIVANGKPRNFDQRGTTDTAIGWKKCEKQAGSNALCPADDRMDRCCGPGNPYSKASTAEDGLPHPGRTRAT